MLHQASQSNLITSGILCIGHVKAHPRPERAVNEAAPVAASDSPSTAPHQASTVSAEDRITGPPSEHVRNAPRPNLPQQPVDAGVQEETLKNWQKMEAELKAAKAALAAEKNPPVPPVPQPSATVAQDISPQSVDSSSAPATPAPAQDAFAEAASPAAAPPAVVRIDLKFWLRVAGAVAVFVGSLAVCKCSCCPTSCTFAYRRLISGVSYRWAAQLG